uniref:Uncharacterized protein n=1 Tax=Electrophorus electricus TaxID=8005 RepID=A0A4W4F5E5_ELEEL
NVAETRAIFDKHHPTHVIHLLLRKCFRDNDNVLHTAHEFGVVKVISCLSTCIFPDKTTYPIDETMIHSDPPHGSNSEMSWSSHDNFNIEDGHVLPALVHKAYKAKHREYTHSHPLDTLCTFNLGLRLSYSVMEDWFSYPEYSAWSGSLALTSFVQYDTSKSNGQMKKTASNAKLLRYGPSTHTCCCLSSAVKETCNWFATTHDGACK